jgi:hypothetical protein
MAILNAVNQATPLEIAAAALPGTSRVREPAGGQTFITTSREQLFGHRDWH